MCVYCRGLFLKIIKKTEISCKRIRGKKDNENMNRKVKFRLFCSSERTFSEITKTLKVLDSSIYVLQKN